MIWGFEHLVAYSHWLDRDVKTEIVQLFVYISLQSAGFESQQRVMYQHFLPLAARGALRGNFPLSFVSGQHSGRKTLSSLFDHKS